MRLGGLGHWFLLLLSCTPSDEREADHFDGLWLIICGEDEEKFEDVLERELEWIQECA